MSLASVRSALSRRALPLAIIAVVPFLFAACNEVGGEVGFWDVIWGMVFFFFWFMAIWIWITCLSTSSGAMTCPAARRRSGSSRSSILPLLGCLIYMIMRPKMTPQDVQMLAQSEAAMKAAPVACRPPTSSRSSPSSATRAPSRSPSTRPSRPSCSPSAFAGAHRRTDAGRFLREPARVGVSSGFAGQARTAAGRREGALAECEGRAPGGTAILATDRGRAERWPRRHDARRWRAPPAVDRCRRHRPVPRQPRRPPGSPRATGR